MPDPLIDFMRPGFPKESLDASSYRNTIEYVGPYSSLAGVVTTGIIWGEYPGRVDSATFEPIEGCDYAILTVIVERKFETADYPGSGTGELVETNYEIDWADIQRSLYEHPVFRIGGGGSAELTPEDKEAIKSWEKNPYPQYKKDYIYSEDDYTTELSSSSPTLSANAQLLARGIQLCVEFWIDKAPVARKSETYVNGPPPEGSAGQKQDPDDFPNLPSGYEWIRSADRGVRRGGQTKWTRDTEWLGAKKVLIDKDEIFWEAT
jgi:hypothetical protein